MRRSNHRELRIGEHDAERRSAQGCAEIGKPRRVFARDAAFVRGFMQEWPVVARVAGDEDRMRAALHRSAIEPRNA